MTTFLGTPGRAFDLLLLFGREGAAQRGRVGMVGVYLVAFWLGMCPSCQFHSWLSHVDYPVVGIPRYLGRLSDSRFSHST